jgi:capsular exopolysaccharide synthesis family protein
VASNLAVTLAQAGKRVVLVDANLRQSRIHRVFELDNSAGLSDVLAENLAAASVMHGSSVKNLTVIPSGSKPENPWGLLRSGRFTQLVADLKERNDLVLFDWPSALDFADAITISGAMDAAIVVTRADRTPREDELQLLDLLKKAHINVLGAVLNGAASTPSEGYHFHEHGSSSRKMDEVTRTILSERHRNEDAQSAWRISSDG